MIRNNEAESPPIFDHIQLVHVYQECLFVREGVHRDKIWSFDLSKENTLWFFVKTPNR